MDFGPAAAKLLKSTKRNARLHEMSWENFDLRARAHRALQQYGFIADFPATVLEETNRATVPAPPGDARDLRDLLWSSIDNTGTRDLDQVEIADAMPSGDIRVRIGIADVASVVKQDFVTDRFAVLNTTSVYTGVATFPMLPERLSTDLTSLVEDGDRRAMVVDFVVAETGEVKAAEVYVAWIKNRARLVYEIIGDWLEGRTVVPESVRRVAGLEEQLRLQFSASQRLKKFRREQGTLSFAEREPKPVMDGDRLQDLSLERQNCAREIIESFMVAANVSVAEFLKSKRVASLRRVVTQPRRWDRIQQIAAQHNFRLPREPDSRALSAFLEQQKSSDPDGFADLSFIIVKLLGPGEYVVEQPGQEHQAHFGLAVHDYTHSTAPNRRFADLVTQRLLPSITPPYQIPELEAIAAHCNDRSKAARKVERLMRKVAAAVLLSRRIGEIFEGIVTGAKAKGTFVRLKSFPAEGRIVRGEPQLDVGDRVRVRLLATDPENGFIDFEAVR